MRRPHHARAVNRNIQKHAVEVDILLRMRVDQIVKMMPGDREHRLAVHLRVIKSIQQVNAAGPRGRQANAQLAGVFGVSAGHERSRFLVPHLDKTNLVLARRGATP